jgi:hypothetical protein
LAGVTAHSCGIALADAAASNQVVGRVRVALTFTTVLRASWVTVTRDTNVGIPYVPVGVHVEEWLALLTVPAHSVVLTIITDPTTGTIGDLIDSRVKVTAISVTVAIASFTLIGLAMRGRPPGLVIIECLASLTVVPLGVVTAETFPLDHSLLEGYTFSRDAACGMSITVTAATDHHVIDGIVVFLTDLLAVVQLNVTQGVQLCEVDAQVGDLDHVLYIITVGVVDADVRREDFEDNLSFS